MSPGLDPAHGLTHGVEARLGSGAAGEIRLCLTPERRRGALGRDFGDEPTFLYWPGPFRPAVLSVDLCGALLPDAPDYARGFIGLAWAIAPDLVRFESAYLRPTNGAGLAPPAPRDQRAVQVFAYPDWKFDRLREVHPGRYEAPADIRPGQWHRLSVDLTGPGPVVSVDGVAVLRVPVPLVAPEAGGIGLWVDIGTDGWFRNLTLEQA